jgi:hypothetical protein
MKRLHEEEIVQGVAATTPISLTPSDGLAKVPVYSFIKEEREWDGRKGESDDG